MSSRIWSVVSICLLTLSAGGAAQINPIGSEFQVGEFSTVGQYVADVAANSAGDFVVTWVTEIAGNEITARRFDSVGSPVGSEFRVNSYTTGSQYSPRVGLSDDGGFVVVWESGDFYLPQTGRAGVFAIRYDSDGIPRGSEFQVNTYTTYAQSEPVVAVSPAGNFVIVWAGWADQDGHLSGVFARLYDDAGAPVGTEFLVNTYTTSFQRQPAVAADAQGAFVVVWASQDMYPLPGQDGSQSGIFGQRHDSVGGRIGTEFQVNTYTTASQYYPAVAADENGNFVVVWAHGERQVLAQRFGSDGAPRGAEFQVNTHTRKIYYEPTIAADADGDFVVAWTGDYDTRAQRFDSVGVPQGTEVQVNPDGLSVIQFRPAVAALPADGFIVVWEGYDNLSGSWSGIFGQRFAAQPPPEPPTHLSLAVYNGVAALSWVPPDGVVDGYEIYAREVPEEEARVRSVGRGYRRGPRALAGFTKIATGVASGVTGYVYNRTKQRAADLVLSAQRQYEFVVSSVRSATEGAGIGILGTIPDSFRKRPPYPIVLLHGLGKNAEVWQTFTDEVEDFWTFGGELVVTPTSDPSNPAAQFLDEPSLHSETNPGASQRQTGDFYAVNFREPCADYSAWSRDDGIWNQGREVGAFLDAIRAQRESSQRFGLVGHSMGGLAARAHLQDGNDQHGVPLLVTYGTPHQGSPLADAAQLAELIPDVPLGAQVACLLDSSGICLGWSLATRLKDIDVDTVGCDAQTSGDGIRDLSIGSDFLTDLNMRALPDDTVYTSIVGISRWAIGGRAACLALSGHVVGRLLCGAGVRFAASLTGDLMVSTDSQDMGDVGPGLHVRTVSYNLHWHGDEVEDVSNLLCGVYRENCLFIRLFSPGDLEVVGPDGERITKTETAIWGAKYEELDTDEVGVPEDVVVVPIPAGGQYTVRVVPEPNADPSETFTLEIEQAGQVTTLAAGVPLSDAAPAGYEVTLATRFPFERFKAKIAPPTEKVSLKADLAPLVPAGGNVGVRLSQDGDDLLVVDFGDISSFTQKGKTIFKQLALVGGGEATLKLKRRPARQTWKVLFKTSGASLSAFGALADNSTVTATFDIGLARFANDLTLRLKRGKLLAAGQ